MPNGHPVLQQLADVQNVVVVTQSENHAQLLNELHTECATKFKKICVITTSKTPTSFLDEFKKHNISSQNYCFIDCTPNIKEPSHSRQVQNVSSPSALTEIGMALSELRDVKPINLVILEDISSLLLYNNPLTVIQFLHESMVKNRNSNAKGIYVILKKDMGDVMDTLSLFADLILEHPPLQSSA